MDSKLDHRHSNNNCMHGVKEENGRQIDGEYTKGDNLEKKLHH